MKIAEEDFELEEEEGRWNLYLLKHIGGNNPRDELQLEGYGYSMVAAMRKIIKNRLSRQQEVYTLQEFISSYKKQVDKLFRAFKGIDGIRNVIV